MKKNILVLVLLMVVTLACNIAGNNPVESGNDGSVSEKRCGDNVCDGPENSSNCPQDCQSEAALPEVKPEHTAQQSREDIAGEIPDSGFRYISFSGEIFTSPNPASMGDFTGRVMEYSGEYDIELWFPINGGKVVQQRNSLTLTGYSDQYYGAGGCAECQWTLDAAAYEPVSFDLEAELNLESIKEGDQTVDELVYQLTRVPVHTITGEAVCCGGAPGPINDPAAVPVLATWFMQRLVNPVHLYSIETNAVEQFPVSPMYFVDIPEENLSYTIVPDLNTP
jgi:hypothetical protein